MEIFCHKEDDFHPSCRFAVWNRFGASVAERAWEHLSQQSLNAVKHQEKGESGHY